MGDCGIFVYFSFQNGFALLQLPFCSNLCLTVFLTTVLVVLPLEFVEYNPGLLSELPREHQWTFSWNKIQSFFRFPFGFLKNSNIPYNFTTNLFTDSTFSWWIARPMQSETTVWKYQRLILQGKKKAPVVLFLLSLIPTKGPSATASATSASV